MFYSSTGRPSIDPEVLLRLLFRIKSAIPPYMQNNFILKEPKESMSQVICYWLVLDVTAVMCDATARKGICFFCTALRAAGEAETKPFKRSCYEIRNRTIR